MCDSAGTRALSPEGETSKKSDEPVCSDEKSLNVSASELCKSVSSQCGHFLTTDESIVVLVKSHSPVRNFDSEDEAEAMDESEVGKLHTY